MKYTINFTRKKITVTANNTVIFDGRVKTVKETGKWAVYYGFSNGKDKSEGQLSILRIPPNEIHITGTVAIKFRKRQGFFGKLRIDEISETSLSLRTMGDPEILGIYTEDTLSGKIFKSFPEVGFFKPHQTEYSYNSYELDNDIIKITLLCFCNKIAAGNEWKI